MEELSKKLGQAIDDNSILIFAFDKLKQEAGMLFKIFIIFSDFP